MRAALLLSLLTLLAACARGPGAGEPLAPLEGEPPPVGYGPVI